MNGAWLAFGALALLFVAATVAGFLALATGCLHLDLGWGRSRHRLGPLTVPIEAPPQLVFEILSAIYLRRARDPAIDVIAGDETVVVAAHLTRVHFYEAKTVEVIELQPPTRMTFRHLTGPVPEAFEEFRLEGEGGRTELIYEGELGIDFFLLGRIAGKRWVVPQWTRAVSGHLDRVKEKAEQRASRRRG